MTDQRGIAAAGLIALVVTGAQGLYLSWPATHGTEIYMTAVLARQPAGDEWVTVRLPIARIVTERTEGSAADRAEATESYEYVPRVGDWWIGGGDIRANARKLRGRPLYVQLTPGEPLWPGGPPAMRALSVSNRPVSGAMNIAGTVTMVREGGRLWLDFAIAPIAVPKEVAAAAAPRVFAVLRVLPSARAALHGVMVNGARY